MRHTYRLFILLFLSLLLSGCYTTRNVVKLVKGPYKPTNQFVDPYPFVNGDIRRVLIVPFQNHSNNHRHPISDNVTQRLSIELQKLGRFEIIQLKETDIEANLHNIRSSGFFNERDVSALAQKYKADAVLYGAIVQYRDLEPLLLGINTYMISASTGQILWQSEEIFDASLTEIRLAGEWYYEFSLRQERRLDKDLIFISMDRFSQFCCFTLVSALSTPQLNKLVKLDGKAIKREEKARQKAIRLQEKADRKAFEEQLKKRALDF